MRRPTAEELAEWSWTPSDGWEVDMVTGERVPFIREYERGYSEVPCPCGQHWDLHKKTRRCRSCMPHSDPGVYRSVAAESAIDDRDSTANMLAEEQEYRELLEEEGRFLRPEELQEVGR